MRENEKRKYIFPLVDRLEPSLSRANADKEKAFGTSRIESGGGVSNE